VPTSKAHLESSVVTQHLYLVLTTMRAIARLSIKSSTDKIKSTTSI